MGEHTTKIILVMGITGAGKSYLIREISGQDVKVGHDLKSCTQTIETVHCRIAGQPVMILDTPGFDDTHRSDTEILTEVADHLAALYRDGFQVCGIIYLHSIQEDRIRGSTYKNLKMFEQLCGEGSLHNVVMLTNRWGSIDESEAVNRENELKDDYWSMYMAGGCTIDRYRDKNDLVRIFEVFLQHSSAVLNIQSEMVDGNKPVGETSAGGLLQGNAELDQARTKFDSDVHSLTKQHEEEMAVYEQQRVRGQQELQEAIDAPKPTPTKLVLLYDASRKLFLKIYDNSLWVRWVDDAMWHVVIDNPTGDWDADKFTHHHGYIHRVSGRQWEEVHHHFPYFHQVFEEIDI